MQPIRGRSGGCEGCAAGAVGKNVVGAANTPAAAALADLRKRRLDVVIRINSRPKGPPMTEGTLHCRPIGCPR
jgi:hypothetical protein